MNGSRVRAFTLSLVCAVAVCLFGSPLGAQGYAMITNGPTIKEALSSWLSTCSTDNPQAKHSRLRATCIQYMTALNERGVGITRVENLSAYVASLVVAPCPKGKARMSRLVVKNGAAPVLDVIRWSRDFAKDEMCLWDSNLSRWVLTLSCGNVIYDDFPAPGVLAREVVVPDPAPPSVMAGQQQSGVSRTRGDTVVHLVVDRTRRRDPVEVRPSGMSGKQVFWTITGLVATGFLGAYIWDQMDKPRGGTTMVVPCCGGGPVRPPNGG